MDTDNKGNTDTEALCYKASLYELSDNTIKVCVEERSAGFVGVLTLSERIV